MCLSVIWCVHGVRCICVFFACSLFFGGNMRIERERWMDGWIRSIRMLEAR